MRESYEEEGPAIAQVSSCQTLHNGIATVVLGGFGRAEPTVLRLWRVQAYLPSEDLAIASEATVDKNAKGA